MKKMKKMVLAVTLLAVMVASAAPVASAQIIGGHHVGSGEYPFIDRGST